MSEPWIGKNYHKTRLFLLGESAYPWFDSKTERWIYPSHHHSRNVIEDILDSCHNTVTMNKISRALTGEHTPSPQALDDAWHRVGFFNYVLEWVESRPNSHQWNKAKSALIRRFELLSAKPKHVIVFGYEMWGRLPLELVDIADSQKEYEFSDGTVCHFWKRHHPSRGDGWQVLHADLSMFLAQ